MFILTPAGTNYSENFYSPNHPRAPINPSFHHFSQKLSENIVQRVSLFFHAPDSTGRSKRELLTMSAVIMWQRQCQPQNLASYERINGKVRYEKR